MAQEALVSKLWKHNNPMKRPRVPLSSCSHYEVATRTFVLVMVAICSFTSGFVKGPSCTTHLRVLKAEHISKGPAIVSRPSAPAYAKMIAAEPVAGLLKTVTVDLEDRSYPIYIGSGILERYVLSSTFPFLVRADKTLAGLYGRLIMQPFLPSFPFCIFSSNLSETC